MAKNTGKTGHQAYFKSRFGAARQVAAIETSARWQNGEIQEKRAHARS
jgi:hypothetical protein